MRREESKSLKGNDNLVPRVSKMRDPVNEVEAMRSSTSSILNYRVPWMRLNRTLSPTQLTRLNPRCKKHELADNEEDGKKVWPLEVRMHSNRPLYF